MNSIFAYDKRTNELKGVNLDLVAGIVASYVGRDTRPPYDPLILVTFNFSAPRSFMRLVFTFEEFDRFCQAHLDDNDVSTQGIGGFLDYVNARIRNEEDDEKRLEGVKEF